MGRTTRAALVTLLCAGGLSLLVGAAGRAAETPDGAVNELLDAVPQQQLDALDGIVCPEQQDAVREAFEVRTGPDGAILGGLPADAIELDVTERSIGEVRLGTEAAEVTVSGRLVAYVDTEALGDALRRSFDMLGTDVDANDIAALVADLEAQLREGVAFTDTVTVVDVDGEWLVCDTIAIGEAAAGSSSEGFCASMTVAELDAIDEERGGRGFSAYARSSWDEASGLCTYDAGSDSIGTVRTGRFDADFGELPSQLPDVVEVLVDERCALHWDNHLFVELPEGYLYVNAPAKGTDDGGIDDLGFPAGIAELLLTKIDEND